jgi:hypothetical protein
MQPLLCLNAIRHRSLVLFQHRLKLLLANAPLLVLSSSWQFAGT